jgi:hypothetical protein
MLPHKIVRHPPGGPRCERIYNDYAWEESVPWSDGNKYELIEDAAARVPAASGVFGLCRPGGWVYIASSNNVQQALFYYLEGNMPWITQQGPTQFTYEEVDSEKRAGRCSELTAEYRPVFLNCV